MSDRPEMSAFSPAELVLAALGAFLIQLEVWVFDPGGPAVVRSLVGLVAAGSLVFLRAAPFRAFVVNGLAIFALIALGSPSDFYQWTNFIALFAVAARTSLRPALAALGLGLAGVATYFWRFPDEGGLLFAGFVWALWIAAWFAGRAQFARLREVELERERDLTRAALATQQARMELEEERGRVARELHDIVGHAVNVMVVHAGAGVGAIDSEPERARTAFSTIAATGRVALSDLDRLLSLLHGEIPRAPLPGLERLDDLCAGVADSGLEVELTVEGDLALVPASVGLAGYRLVQEALTNVLKHAGADHATVEVTVDDSVHIVVRDDGRGGRPAAGRGLRGMVERTELHGGVLSFGPLPEGGFGVESRIPIVDGWRGDGS